MLRSSPIRLVAPLLLGLAFGCAVEAGNAPADLGEFPLADKADAIIEVEVPFEVGPAVDGEPGELRLSFRTWGKLQVRTKQDRARSWERLQLVAESTETRRRSWRGRSPYVTVYPREAGEGTEYSLSVLNWGDEPAYGTLRVATEPPPGAGVAVAFNSPDCLDCDAPEGELRDAILGVIQEAKDTLDVAIYGLNDPQIVDALCNAAEDGVSVTLYTDETSEDPDDSRSYYEHFYGSLGVTVCGAEVVPVRSYGLMHHKFIVADRDGDQPVLLTGSANYTTAGITQNHNHVVVVTGAPQLVEAYMGELGQFDRHCASERLDDRDWCTECTPACTENHSPDGVFPMPTGTVEALFSPGDDAMRALRGAARSVRLATPDPACFGDDADCICRKSGSRYACDYCAQGDDGWGLIGTAEDRIYMSMYSATDSCFALGVARAHARGVEVRTVWDFVKAGSKYSRDDYLCGAGVETWVSVWGGGSSQVRNHNKVIVVDDTAFTGSLNLSASGAEQNHENTLVIEDPTVADTFADYIASEITLLGELGVVRRGPGDCLCNDIVDNDGDGLTDGDDDDCDGAVLYNTP